MREEQSDDHRGLLDGDPALDAILYQELGKEDNRPRTNGGCLSLGLLVTLPPPALFCLLKLIA